MSEQQNVDVIRRGYDAFARGDLETMLGLFDENIEWTSPGPPELPTAGTRRGHQQVAEFFKTVNDLFDFESFETTTFIADGDRVVVLGRDTARFKPTGARLTESFAHVYTLKNGKVTRFEEYIDTAATVAELQTVRQRV